MGGTKITDSEEKPKVKKPSTAEDPDTHYKIVSVFAYFIVLVVIGIPIWWYTTRVYRATLPLGQMYDHAVANRTEKHLGIPLSLEYDVLITFVNPDPENIKLDIQGEDIDQSLQPFLETVSPVADFIVKSQWLYLVELGPIPRKIIDHYALFEHQLPHIITPLEKRIWSHLSPRPCLNLVLYVSQCNVPLFIYSDAQEKIESNAFLSPRWGGIYIINPDKESCDKKVFEPSLQNITSTFVFQIKKLLGMDDVADLDELKKSKVQAMVESTRRTLKSLAQLLSEINSIVISDDVALKINIAVENADLADSFLEANEVDKALKFAKVAFQNSEAAFSDPSLLALLYFPDDQKYAVYIPLFLPVMIPVLMSLVTVRKWFLARKQAYKTKVD